MLSNFNPFTEEEVGLVKKITSRIKLKRGKVGRKTLGRIITGSVVAYDCSDPYTTCVIKSHVFGETFIGVSKRMRKDSPDPKIGKAIALSNTIRNWCEDIDNKRVSAN